MCTGNPIADVGIAIAGSLLGSKAMAPKAPEMPAVPEMPKPPATLAEQGKAPERDPYKTGNQKLAMAQGPSSTMLTGAGGVAPSSLSLGRTSLYDNEKSKLGA